MLHTPTKEEKEANKKVLLEFLEDIGNWCLIYNYMLEIKSIRRKEREKILKEIND